MEAVLCEIKREREREREQESERAKARYMTIRARCCDFFG